MPALVLTLILVVSAFGAVAPPAGAHATVGGGHTVTVDKPANTDLIDRSSNLLIAWNYSSFDTASNCRIWVNDSSGSTLWNDDRTCTGSSGSDTASVPASDLPAGYEDTISVDVQVVESGTLASSGRNSKSPSLDTLKPRIAAPTVEQAGSFVTIPSSGMVWSDTGTIRVAITDDNLDVNSPSANTSTSHSLTENPSGDWTVTLGDHGEQVTFTLAARDTFRWSETSESYTIGVDEHGPTVGTFDLTNADHNLTVNGKHWVAGNLSFTNATSDAHSGVSSVTLFREEPAGPSTSLRQLQSVTGSPFSVNTTQVSDWPPIAEYGPFTLGLRTHDAVMNQNWSTPSQNETIWVDNTPPTAQVTSSSTVGTAEPTVTFQIDDTGVGLDTSTLTLRHKAPGNTSFSSTAFSNLQHSTGSTATFDWTPPNPIANGTHTFEVKVRDNLTNELVAGALQVTVGDEPPTVVTGDNTVLQSGNRLQQGADLEFNLTASDSSGLDRVEVHLSQGGQIRWTGTHALAGNSVSEVDLAVPLGNASNASIPFPNLGQYAVYATVYDVYGRSTLEDISPAGRTVNITPRLHVESDVNLTGGVVYTNVTAGVVSSETPIDGSCQDGNCTLSKLIVEYQDPEGKWQHLTTRTIPNPTNPNATTGLYTYPLAVDLSDAGVDEQEFSTKGFVRFRANVSYGTPAAENFEAVATEFVKGAGGFHVIEPGLGEVNATGNITFKVKVSSLPPELHEPDANVSIEVKDLGTGNVVNLGRSYLNHPVDGDGNPRGTGLYELPIWRTSHGHLAKGTYQVTYELVNETASPDKTYAASTVPFAVETAPPAIDILESTYHDDGTNKWIGSHVNLSVNITTGFADLNGLGNVTTLFFKDDAGWVVAPQVTWEHWNDTRELPPKNLSLGEGDGFYHLNATVVTPDIIGHAQTVKLFVNATNNANGTASGQTGRKGFNSVIVKLDEEAPTGGLFEEHNDLLGVNTTNASLVANPAFLRFDLADVGSGLPVSPGEPGNVTVTVFDRTDDGYLRPWNGTGWGDVNASASVWYEASFDAGLGNWTLENASATADLFSVLTGSYETRLVQVNVTDNAGNRLVTDLLPVAPDLGRPDLIAQNLSFVEGNTFTRAHQNVNWGDPGNRYDVAGGSLTLRLNVTEDQALDHVAFVVETPNGSITHHNVSDATCAGTVPHLTCEVTLKGAALGQVGNHRVGAVAVDAARNVGRTANTTAGNGTLFLLNFTVVDVLDPQFNFMGFEPTPPAPDTPLFAQVKAFDDGGIANATTWWWIPDRDNSTVGPFDMSCEPAEGEDDPRWVLCELANSDGPNLDLVAGESVFFNVTLEDTAGNEREISAVGEVVSDNAPPIVRKEVPPADVNWINASTTVQVSIFDRNLDTSTVVVETGLTADNLTELDATLDDVGNNTYLLNLTPEGLDDGDQWVVRVTAEDLQGANTTKTWTFQVDTGAPTVTHSLQGTFVNGANQTWLSGASLVTLTASDDGSGVADGNVTYRVDDGALRTYTGAFALPEKASGETTVTVRVVDVAGNANTTSFTVFADQASPSISMVQKSGRTVEAQVGDGDGVGLNRSAIQLLYTLEGSDDFSRVAMTNSIDNVWSASIPSEVRGRIQFYVEVQDLVGNVGRYGNATNPVDLITGNNAPQLTLSTPSSGATVKGTLNVTWTATDTNEDTVTLTFLLRDGSGSESVLRSGVGNTGSASLDVSGVSDGNYTLVVEAGDGITTSSQEVDVRVMNTDVVQPVNTPTPDATAGEPVTVTVTVNHPFKSVSKVTAIVERNGQPLEEVEMTSQGNGTYTLDYEPTEPGAYNVSVVVTYADGSQDERFQVASFDAAAPAGPGLSPQILLLVALGAVAVLLGAYAAFGRWDG